LYVISDLHIGGAPGFQIFTASKLLAGFIRSLIAEHPADGERNQHLQLPAANMKVALVLNGDTVDFLAEEPGAYLDIHCAVDKLKSIVERAGSSDGDGFKDVFAALQDFIKKPDRHLIIVLGNHDLELALPHAQTWLENWLTQGDDAARGRLTFATDGSGYRCNVGSSSVLCIHGEIADDWNLVDHQGLRAIAHKWKAGRSDFSWTPSGGTQLVRDVMNDIKHQFPFVDLLKPEKEAVLPILKSLNATTFARAFGATSAALKSLKAGIRRERFLSTDGRTMNVAPQDVLSLAALQLLDTNSAQLSAAAQAESDTQAGLDPIELARQASQTDDLLSLWRVVRAIPGSIYARFIQGKTPEQTLRESLRFILQGDMTFNLHSEDEPFEWIKENVNDGIDFVVAGHTHLARSIPWGRGGYLNTGTWANLMKLDGNVLDDDRLFADVLQQLKNCTTVDALRAARLAHEVPTVASITMQAPGGPATGRLHEARQIEKDVRLVDNPDAYLPIR
jgi:UDP-2,3-diacylglucosamine pyrophosphatase LpxH